MKFTVNANLKKVFSNRYAWLFGAAVATFSYTLLLRADGVINQVVVPARIAAAKKYMPVAFEHGPIQLGWFLSATALDVKVFGAASGGASPSAPLLVADRVSVRLRPLSLLLGRAAVSFSAKAYGGSLSGVFSQGLFKKVVRVSGSADGVDLARYDALAEKFGVKLGGKASLDAEITWDPKDPKVGVGTIDLSIAEASIVESKLIDLPATTFTSAGGRIELKEGKFSSADLGLKGSDVNVDVEVSCNAIANPLGRSRIYGSIEAKMAAGYQTKIDPMVKAMLKPAEANEGYRWRVDGTIARPSVVPDRRGGKK